LEQFYSAQVPRNTRQGIMRSVLNSPKSRLTRYPDIGLWTRPVSCSRKLIGTED
jgi:hypothetical protein